MSGIDWESYRGQQKLRRKDRLGHRTDKILALRKQGYIVEELSPTHFRINSRLDVWPIHNNWHDLKTRERGGTLDLATWVKERIRPNETGRL